LIVDVRDKQMDDERQTTQRSAMAYVKRLVGFGTLGLAIGEQYTC
jgi:hypothetical protein